MAKLRFHGWLLGYGGEGGSLVAYADADYPTIKVYACEDNGREGALIHERRVRKAGGDGLPVRSDWLEAIAEAEQEMESGDFDWSEAEIAGYYA